MSVEFRIRDKHVVDVWLEQGSDCIVIMAGNFAIADLRYDGTLYLDRGVGAPGIQTDADGRIVCDPPLGASRKAVLEEVLAAWWDTSRNEFDGFLSDQIAACDT